MKQYYIPYTPKMDINIIYLLYIYSLANYNTTTNCFDTVNYNSIRALEKQINDTFGKGSISSSAINRMIHDERYNKYLSVDQKKKTIRLYNDIRSINSFVVLSDKEVDFLLQEKDNLLIKYYLYIKYYCGKTKGIKQDFTIKQFLNSCGYSDKSNNYISKVSYYNKLLQDKGFIRIEQYRDNLGHTRNCYSII